MDPMDPENMLIFNKSPAAWLEEIRVKTPGSSVKYDDKDLRATSTSQPCFDVTCTVTGFHGSSFESSWQDTRKQIAKQRSAILMLNSMGISKDDLGNSIKKKHTVFGSSGSPASVNVVSSSSNPGPSNPGSSSPAHVYVSTEPSRSVQGILESQGQIPVVEVVPNPGQSQQPVNVTANSFGHAEANMGPLQPVEELCQVDGNPELLSIENNPIPKPVNEPAEFIPVAGQEPGNGADQIDSGFDSKKNHTSILNEFCSGKMLPQAVYNVENQSGPPHQPEFTVTCTITLEGRDPIVERLTRCTSVKKIRQVLAYRILPRLEYAMSSVGPAMARLAEERRIALLGLEIGKPKVSKNNPKPNNCCSTEGSQESSVDGTKNYRTPPLVGVMVERIKGMVAADELGLDSISLVDQFQDERRASGFIVNKEYFPVLLEDGLAWLCSARMFIEGIEIVSFGSGKSEEEAKAAAAKKMLEEIVKRAG